MPIFKGPIMASVADHMEQMELPSIACGVHGGTVTVENSVKYVYHKPSDFFPVSLPTRKESTDPYKDLYSRVHNFIHASQ